jgi:phytoene dehydrogenase-like protein
VDLAHPLDDGSAGVMVRSIDETVRRLGADGDAWRRVFGASSAHFEDLLEDMLAPIVHLPRHPLRLARFGIAATAPATLLARSWKTPQGRALFGGVAAHAFAPLSRPMSSSVGCALIDACHAFGWPVAKGGSRSITDALASVLREAGGKIETGRRVRSLAELDDADLVVLDLAPAAVAEVAEERLPARIARAYRRYRHGPGAFKVDLAVDGGVPWTNEACRRAGTVHVAGTFEEIAIAERTINRGSMPERPFMLVGQQYLADPGRSKGDLHPVWVYAHVPSGYAGDATERVLSQLERFAPGVRNRIVASSVRGPADLAAYNSNYVGGDIITGANTPIQVLFRPRFALDPYSTGIDGVYICSAATPPGAGAHGMNGYNAARSALRNLAR